MAKEPGPRNYRTDQMNVIEEVDASLTRAFDEARVKLEIAGVRRGAEQGAFCFQCGCEQFEPHLPFGLDWGGDHPFNPCMRLGCGHAFTKHYVY